MTHLLGIDFYYDNPKNRLSIEKIMIKHNGTLECVTDKNGIFSFKDNDSKQKDRSRALQTWDYFGLSYRQRLNRLDTK